MPRETLTAVRLRRIAATALVSAGALAGPAVAQEPGLVIDPESPSAKEYALPLENERRLADPGTVALELLGVGVGVPAQVEAVQGVAERSPPGPGVVDQSL